MTETFVQHCITLYTALDDRAKIHPLKDGEQARVFAGNYTEVFKSTGLSRTYYTSTRRALERNGAILILQRGARAADTVIVLRGLPDTWDVEGWNDGHGVKKDLTDDPKYATLVADLEEHKKSLGGINVASALMEFEKRVVALETEIAELRLEVKRQKTKITKLEKGVK